MALSVDVCNLTMRLVVCGVALRMEVCEMWF